jgi:hypothetical protein
MKSRTLLLLLAGLNVAALSYATGTAMSPTAPSLPVVRASAFELIDERGTLRSRLEVKPGGEIVMQLFDQNGVIKVKLGAGADGSGLYLADETTQSGVQIIARQASMPERKTTGITLTREGRERTIAP